MSGRSTRSSKKSKAKKIVQDITETEVIDDIDDDETCAQSEGGKDDVLSTSKRSSDESDGDSDDIYEEDAVVDSENIEDVTDSEDIEEESEIKKKEESLNNHILLMTGIVVPIVMVVFMLFFTTNESTLIDIQANIEALFKDFKNQPEITHRKLKSRAVTFLNHTTSPQPFVLMITACDSDNFTASCFANRVGHLLTSAPLIIESSSYTNIRAEEAKLEIDRKLAEIFQMNQFPSVAVIHNLQDIPYEASMLFYKYCDHDHPSFKEVAIIFTVTIPQEYCTMSKTNEVENDGLVETYISEHSPWAHNHNFDIDKVAALLSRISDMVIFLRGESTEMLNKVCTA